jgi:dephospho-CoA kinase
MIRILAIGGEPCTGKTTLVKRFVNECGLSFTKKRVNKLLDLLHNEEKSIYILGVYDDNVGTFQGTDKLSMAVQPDVVDFLNNLKTGTVIFEGDRLFNNKMMNHLSDNFGEDLMVLVLKASDDILNERHIDRNDDQSDSFKQSRRTKVNNIMTNLDLMNHLVVKNNNTKEEMEEVFELVNRFVNI